MVEWFSILTIAIYTVICFGIGAKTNNLFMILIGPVIGVFAYSLFAFGCIVSAVFEGFFEYLFGIFLVFIGYWFFGYIMIRLDAKLAGPVAFAGINFAIGFLLGPCISID